jgi:CheY-like chemotaxis protein/predicted Zn-dependent protease
MQKIDIFKIYQRRTALVIDDFPDMRGSIRRMLANFGMASIDTASTGEEAVLKCEHGHYDIILCDYNLGDGKNGQQILEELRYRNLLKFTSSFVMITAETTRKMVFGALEYQPDDYLTKPFTQSVLQLRLDRLMQEKEALFPINQAIDDNDLDRAIERCDDRIALHDRYEEKAYRLQARCYYMKHKLSQARKIYADVQKERPLDWAQLGLGKCLLEMGELDEAEQIFAELIANNCLCLEVFDCLAEVKNRKGELAIAQQLLEHASEISPNAILRQQQLARISQENNDWDSAEKAHRKVIRLGSNSCYESPELYFSYARCINDQMRQAEVPDGKRVKDVEDVLDRARRKYRDDPAARMQADVIHATTFANAGKLDDSKRLMQQIEQKLAGAETSPGIELALDLARGYQAAGERNKAKAILLELAQQQPDNEAIWEAIDRVSDEPLSPKGKEKAIDLNNQGKELFANKQYAQAIKLFGEALRLYPNNIALKLNLLLALVREMGAIGPDAPMVARGEQVIRSLDKLPADHALYERFTVLCSHMEQLREQLAESAAHE